MPKIIEALRPLIISWLARRIAAALTAAAIVIGTTEADTQGAAAFATGVAVAVAVFACDCLQAWIRRRWLKPAPELTTPPAL
ncbi:MAG: hypothetical protein JWM59_1171 [Verrucomicrobiales bacterium]|nr:hypothetical protein [Verrucomicrobiales bacterium]